MGEMLWVLRDKLLEGSIKHENIDALLPMIRWQWRHLEELVTWVPSFEHWELGYMRDTNPEKEVSYWLRATYAYLEYLHQNPKVNGESVFEVILGLMNGQEIKTNPQNMLQEIKDLIEFSPEELFYPDSFTADGKFKAGEKYLR